MSTAGRRPFSICAMRASGVVAARAALTLAANSALAASAPATGNPRTGRRWSTGTSLFRKTSARILPKGRRRLKGGGCFGTEGHEDRGVIARPDLRPDGSLRGRPRQRVARDDVVDSPADVAVPQVAPGGPPREEPVIVGVQRAPDVDEALADEPVHQGPLVLALADHPGLELLGMDVPVRQRHVQVAGNDEATAPRPHF